MGKIHEIIERWSTVGIKLPYAYDSAKKTPSITLFILYIATLCLLGSLTWLHFDKSLAIATGMTMSWWALAYVFYLMRSLSKAKFDLQSRSIELDSGEKEEKKEE